MNLSGLYYWNIYQVLAKANDWAKRKTSLAKLLKDKQKFSLQSHKCYNDTSSLCGDRF